MKAVKLVLGGKTHYLALTGEALFAIQDKFGSAETLITDIQPNTRESFVKMCEAIAVLAENGELVRRDLGYTPECIRTTDEFRRLASPPDIISMKQALLQAITLGFGREIEADTENEEVDLALAELNQKKN